MLAFLLLQSFISVPVLSYVAIEYLKITEKWCLDGKFHKSLPGPEDELHSQVKTLIMYTCSSVLCAQVSLLISKLRINYIRS
jgi:hypothetical protein